MIRKFNRITDTLSRFENEYVLPKIVSILENCLGESQAVTNRRIIEMYGVSGKESEARVRKVIYFIRNQGVIPCLIASSKGYYIATDAKDITDYEDSLRGRINAIRCISRSIHSQGIAVFGEDAIREAAEETRRNRLEEERKLKLALKLKREQQLKKKRKRKPVLRLKPRKRRNL